MSLEWTTTETPPTPEPVTTRHELHVLGYRAVRSESGATGWMLAANRLATPDDLARLGYVPATPPESKQRVDGFLGTDVTVADYDNVTRMLSQEQMAREKATRERDEARAALGRWEEIAARHGAPASDDESMRRHMERVVAALTAEVERLHGERDALRERYAGLERAARNWASCDVPHHVGSLRPEAVRCARLDAIRDALAALDSAPAPTDAAQSADGRGGKAAEVESHEPADPVLADAGLRWVRYPTREPPAWELQHCSLGTVWDNGVWHTWDARGIGGENASDYSVAAAKASVEAALIRQERRPIKGWSVHGFDLDADDGDDEEPAAPSTGGSLWTTPARVGQPPLPEAAVDPTVTREQVVAAIEAQGERVAAFRGGFDPDPFGAQKANPPKIPDGSPATTDAARVALSDGAPLRCGAGSCENVASYVTGRGAWCVQHVPTGQVAAQMHPAPADAAREAAAEILAAFPRCEDRTCPEPARFHSLHGGDYRFCEEHKYVHGTDPVPWLPAIEVAERIAKGRADGK